MNSASNQITNLPINNLFNAKLNENFPSVNSAVQKRPNVFVAHHSEGLEVIHLYTGFTLCSLPFESEDRNIIWDDLNDDLIIDQIEAFSGKENALVLSDSQKSLGCMTVVRTGRNFEEELFNGSICYESSHLKKLKKDSQYFENQPQPSYVVVTAPITFKTSGDSKSIAYLVSNGKLTAYKPNGRQQWQIQTKSTKTPLIDSLYLDLFPLSTDSDSETEEYILATGQYLTVVDKEGTLIAEIRVSPSGLVPALNILHAPKSKLNQLCSKPLIADFNNDKLNDIILVTCNSYIGFRFEEESTSILFQIFLLVMFVTLLLLIIKNMTSEAAPLQTPSPSPYPSKYPSKDLGGLNKQH